MIGKVSEDFNISGFHQSFSLWVGEQFLEKVYGVDVVGASGKSVALDCVCNLDVWVNPFIGYALECLVVVTQLKG